MSLGQFLDMVDGLSMYLCLRCSAHADLFGVVPCDARYAIHLEPASLQPRLTAPSPCATLHSLCDPRSAIPLVHQAPWFKPTGRPVPTAPAHFVHIQRTRRVRARHLSHGHNDAAMTTTAS